jgi:hypothetical protein
MAAAWLLVDHLRGMDPKPEPPDQPRSVSP